MSDPSEAIFRLRELIAQSSRIVGFTGAGISTESGIPDYRSKGGIWNRYQPVYFEEFLRDPEKRRMYFQGRVRILRTGPYSSKTTTASRPVSTGRVGRSRCAKLRPGRIGAPGRGAGMGKAASARSVGIMS